MKSNIAIRIALCTAFCIGTGQTQQTTTPGSATGTAIGNGVKSFINALFPSGTALVDLVQGWLKKKLSPDQSADLKKNADAQIKKVSPDPVSAQTSLQNAADTLKLASVALGRTTKAASNTAAMIAIIETTNPKTALPMSRLAQQWNDAKSQIQGLKEDDTLKNARAAVKDIAVSNALVGLDDILHGPIDTITTNLKPDGDRIILLEQLRRFLDAAVNFNSLGVVLLGSTGTEITRGINDVTKAGGASMLDQMTLEVVRNANTQLPKPKNPLSR